MPNVFELADGDIKVWIDQEALHILAGDAKYGDPAELTVNMARSLASTLQKFADELERC